MLFETKAAKYWFEKINQTWNGVLRINCTIAGKMFWKDGLSKIALEYDLSCIIRKDFFLHKKVILFFRRKIEDHLIQIDKWKHDIFCLFGKDGILFSLKIILSFFQKCKDDLLSKNTLPVSLEKMMFILEYMIFFLIGKLKMTTKFTQSNLHRENQCD